MALSKFYYPHGIASDRAGNLYVTEMEVRVATGEVTTLAGSSQEGGNLDSTGRAARFSGPRGLAYDGAGVLFVADLFNNTIRKVVVASGEVSTVPCSDGEGGVDGGTIEVLRSPWGLATDGAGHLFVSEQSGRSVRQIDLATGKVTTLAGKRAGAISWADGVGDAACFASPMAMVSDGAGALLVADDGNHIIRKIDIVTRLVTTVLGDPEQSAGLVRGLGARDFFLGG